MLAETDYPRHFFSDFITETGKGKDGLYDYWQSSWSGAIDLTGSIVMPDSGWYKMKYRLYLRWFTGPADLDRRSDPLIWRRLRVRSKIMAVVNASVDGGNNYCQGGNMVLDIGGNWGQSNWRKCNKCQDLAFDDGVFTRDLSCRRITFVLIMRFTVVWHSIWIRVLFQLRLIWQDIVIIVIVYFLQKSPF